MFSILVGACSELIGVLNLIVTSSIHHPGFLLDIFRIALLPLEFSSALLSLPSTLLSLSSALLFSAKAGRFLASFLDQISIKQLLLTGIYLNLMR